MFGVLKYDVGFDHGFGIALKNSYDYSMRIATAGGGQFNVCSNTCISGDSFVEMRTPLSPVETRKSYPSGASQSPPSGGLTPLDKYLWTQAPAPKKPFPGSPISPRFQSLNPFFFPPFLILIYNNLVK